MASGWFQLGTHSLRNHILLGTVAVQFRNPFLSDRKQSVTLREGAPEQVHSACAVAVLSVSVIAKEQGAEVICFFALP
jgi:hypothetical protein